ncbi:MAG: COG1361 S-layer family protein [Nanoarchaeota archaeon]|nr:COG1361 S-layer family protein [Nanoarchaeota archaeon]MBU1004226.1 COG1361 S-layer family protein [Nanoarchaeota archaeon]MBU1945824.1 COG1361 S-layer family protein [Nanoarchaeota archaeon]
MNKRGLMIGLIVVCFLISSVFVIGANTVSFYSMNVSMVNQEPSPAEAGRYVTVRFKLENAGRENAEDIIIELLPRYPFSLDPGESAVKSIGSIYSRQTGAVGVIKDYRLKVDENALEGNNEIKLRYKIRDNEWVELEPFYINVRPHDILVSLEKIDAPSMIKPGETTQVGISLKNLASSFIKDITVELDLSGVPFATINSTNKKIIKQIDAESSGEVVFNLMAEPSAESKLYKVPIKLEFFDRLGTRYLKNETVGLTVGAEPDLSITLESSQIYSKGGMGDVSIKFVNKGVTDIKFMNIMLEETSEFKIISPSEVYLGNIDSDDYETTDFKISLKKVKGDEVNLPLSINYKDANNNEYERDVNVKLKIYSSSEAKALGLKKGNGATGIFIVIVIVAVGFFFYRRWKKKKDGKKESEGFKLKIPFFKKK